MYRLDAQIARKIVENFPFFSKKSPILSKTAFAASDRDAFRRVFAVTILKIRAIVAKTQKKSRNAVQRLTRRFPRCIIAV